MPIPKWRYEFTKPVAIERSDVPAMLRQWHRGMLLGIYLDSLEIDGVPLCPEQLFMLNLWIEAWGAWRASRQDYFEAWRRLDAIISTKAVRVSRKGPYYRKAGQGAL